MSVPLTHEELQRAVRGTAAAFRCVTEYQPAGGPGDKVFPPTYEGGKYATEKRYVPGRGGPVDCVLLDSVQSQANRMELALLDAWEAGRIELPVIVVEFDNERLEKRLRVTSLDAPHRIADAILRDSFNGAGEHKRLFRHSDHGKRLDLVDVRNATPLLEMCPTALIFGMWDSTGPRGGLGAKFQRAIVSEIVGQDAVAGVRTGSRIDPLGIQRDEQTTIFAAESPLGWTLDKHSARTDGKRGEAIRRGDGKPSEINHGNVTPSIKEGGGFTVSKAVQTTTLSLPALRRLRFPRQPDARTQSLRDDGGQAAADVAAQTALAALGLCAATLAREAGCDLRSRCQLIATTPFEWEFFDQPGEREDVRFSLSADAAISLLTDAVADLQKHIPDVATAWKKREPFISLTPSDELLELVVRSQKLAVAGKGDTGAEE